MCLIGQAREFRDAYGCVDSPENELMQFNLISEEFSEFEKACNFEPDAACLKELADLVYVCAQYAANLGWDLDEALRRVHESNLSKLGSDGKPLRRADGKVLKGPNYKPPALADLAPDHTPIRPHWGR
tara:strand:- start:10 stop:393 length:384 start_codon:yes stop_codon:yes gene_type:complete